MSTENSAPQDEVQKAEAPLETPSPAETENSPTEGTAEIQASPDAAIREPDGPDPGVETASVSPTPELETPSTESPMVSPTVTPAPVGAVTSDAPPPAELEPEPQPVAEVLTPEVEAPVAEKPKLQLNPSTTPEDARPIPSIGGEVGVAGPVSRGPIKLPLATDEEIEAEVARTLTGMNVEKPAANFATSEQAGAVEIPAQESIDASIQAAIEEAMTGSSSQASSGGDLQEGTTDPEDLEPGQKLSGVVQSISGDNVFLDFGMRMSGVVPLRQFGTPTGPLPGETIEVLFDKISEEEGLILTRLPGGKAAVVQSEDWSYLSKGQMVECMVKKTNKGGLEVTVGSLRGFIPASQVDIGFVEDMESFVGKKLTVEITELKPAKKNLVLSRRKVLNARRADAKKQLMEELKADQIRTGTVKTLKEYGAFVDLGGIDGFLPISQMSWMRIGHPSEILAEGQEIEVKILSIDQEKNKISLGMRQLTQNPWKAAETKYEKGATVTGRVTKTETFGAFVELEPGIEGLVHISELDHHRVKRVTEVINVDDMIEVQVIEVDPAKKRISLSMKALKAKPEPVERPAEPEPEKYERKRKGPLKGGTGDPSKGGGGLFGNPGDFGKQ